MWAALHDAACLKRCVPGCLALDRTSPTRFDLSVLVPIGPVSLVVSGMVETSASDPNRRLCLTGKGDGTLAGLATGTAHITLSDVRSGCHLAYVLDVEPRGPFAFMGTLLFSSLARRLVARFGETFATRVGAAAQARRPDILSRPTISTAV